MTRKDLPAQAANIKRAVGSTATCSQATVDSLKSLLLLEKSSVPSSKNLAANARRTRPPPPAQRVIKGQPNRAKKQPEVLILEVPEINVDLILPQERRALATEVVNLTLKALTEAVRKPHSKLAQKHQPLLPRSPSNTSLSNGSESVGHLPLQPLCIDRVSTTPDRSRPLRYSFSGTSMKETLGLIAQAECARIAFATLRLMHVERDSGSGMPYLQLEHGMSALIGKLIALGLDDLAVKELRILKRRLEDLAISTSRDSANSLSGRNRLPAEEQPAKKETLSGLLKFSGVDARGPLLALMICLQLQVLKLVASRADPKATEAMIEHLQLSVPYSPANLIQAQIDSELPASQAKATQQLASLAQLLMSLCPSASSVKDEEASGLQNISPSAALQFQLLALEIRSMGWKRAVHRGNVAKEMLEPFASCLACYHRRCRVDRAARYSKAKAAFRRLCDQVDIMNNPDNPNFDQALINIYQLLADLAQDGENYSEALNWVRKSTELSVRRGTSRSRICALTCRTATLQIRVCGKHRYDDHIVSTLTEAAKNLDGNLPNGSVELDELLVAVASLRRAVFSVLHDTYKSSIPEEKWPPEVVGQCSEILLLGIRFLVRYVGNHPGLSGSEKVVSRYLQRSSLAKEVSNPFIESIVALARYSIISSAEDWARIEEGLQDCLRLALNLENFGSSNVPEAPKGDSKPSVFVSLSNTYWHRYLNSKQVITSSKDMLRNLRTSIEIMKNRSIHEKIAAMLPTKLEKLGIQHESSREFKKAGEAYAGALHLQVDSGCLEAAVEAAATKPIALIFDNTNEQVIFGRLLFAYARTTIRVDDKVPYTCLAFDNATLPPSGRGVMLEQQLSAIVSILRIHGMSAQLCDAIQGLVSLLLAVYTTAQFPVRRFRVVNLCLQLLSTHPTIFSGEVLDQISKEPFNQLETERLGFDGGLSHFVPHLVASRDVSLLLREHTPGIKTVEIRVEEWSKVVQDCSDWILLQTRISDMFDWLNQLELLADYLEMQGMELTRLSVLHILASVQEVGISTTCHALIIKLSALGLQYVRLGYPGKAGRVLQKAQTYIESGGIPSEVCINWHLAYAEYALEMGNIAKSEEHLGMAQVQLEAVARGKSTQKKTSTERSRFLETYADVAYVSSSIAAGKGQFSKALLFSRRSIKLNRRAWATLERLQSKSVISDHVKPRPLYDAIDTLTDSVSEISISRPQAMQTVTTTYIALQGVPFWSLVPRLYRGLHHLSQIYAHEGLFSEAQYYSEESQKIAEAVNARYLKSQSLAQLGSHVVRSGSSDRGAKLLEQAYDTTSSLQRDRHFVALQLHLMRMHALKEDWRSAESAANLCEQTLSNLLSPAFIDGLIHQTPVIQSLNNQMNGLALQDKKPPRRPQVRGRLPAKNSSSKPVAQAEPAVATSKSVAACEISTLSRMKGDILRQRACAAMYGKKPDLAQGLLLEAAKYMELAKDRVFHEILGSRLLLQQGLERMTSDPVFGVLPESTVAHPSTRYLGDRLERSPQKLNNITPPRNRALKAPVRKTRRSRSPMPSEFIEPLNQALDTMNRIYLLATTAGTTASVHLTTDVMVKTLMMLSAITQSKPCNASSSAFAVYMIELGRIVAMMRESMALQVERSLAMAQDAADGLNGGDFALPQSPSTNQPLAFSDFQKEYIDIIPTSWTVISLSLSGSRDEIRVSKMRSGQTPFILNLPLNRHNSRDADEDIFGFDQAKAELQDMITLANYSTHDAQDMSRKGAKSEWWEARAALDARLKDLLVNVESIWFGGFRGVFSQQIHSPDLLSRFQQSLYNILDRHLPSRQKPNKGRKGNRTMLDPRVLELLVEMGDPDKVDDLDEPLMDLLYFIVDILQFNGERNAYDEIDFDSIAIETTDALRHYHQASKSSASGDENHHTILILDKALHCFPWESLPCMSGHAISRLPSLGCLRDRILRQQQQQGRAKPANEEWQVDRKSGAFVLNPGGDLKATQTKFEEPLENLADWESVIGREPTEDEMRGCLESRDIFLYFGHGSGGQYIRSRTVKMLDRCSVALLMGCSSGALTEAGEFEPYGTPINYMHAGCPALLATLWDVTDKDIDRFSYTVLEQWGLLREPPIDVSGSPVKKAAKQRGKSKAAAVKSVDKNLLSLDQAVVQGRESCILKYLNGAAPVVYGVPVFLSK